MRNVPVVIVSAIYFGISTIHGSDLPQSSADSDSTPQFSWVRQELPEVLIPFIINETPGLHENVTLSLTREQYLQHLGLITSLTHVSFIVRN